MQILLPSACTNQAQHVLCGYHTHIQLTATGSAACAWLGAASKLAHEVPFVSAAAAGEAAGPSSAPSKAFQASADALAAGTCTQRERSHNSPQSDPD